MLAMIKLTVKDFVKLKYVYILLALFLLAAYSMLIMGADSLIYDYNHGFGKKSAYRDPVSTFEVYPQSLEPCSAELKGKFLQCYDKPMLTYYRSMSLTQRFVDYQVYLIIGDLSLLRDTESIVADHADEEIYVLVSDTVKKLPKSVYLDDPAKTYPVQKVDTEPLDQLVANDSSPMISNGREPSGSFDHSSGNLYMIMRHYPAKFLSTFSDDMVVAFLNGTIVRQDDTDTLETLMETFADSPLKLVPRSATASGRESNFLTTFFFPFLILGLAIFIGSLLSIMSGFIKETSKRSYVHYLCGATLGKLVGSSVITLAILFIPAYLFSDYLVKLRELSWHYLLGIGILHLLLILGVSLYNYFILKNKYFVQVLRGI